MKKYIGYIFLCVIILACSKTTPSSGSENDINRLRSLYSSDQKNWPKPIVHDSVINFQDIGILPPPTFPKDNPYSEAKKKLGKTLFFDPRLSKSGQIACASCHNPELAWTDNSRRSFGHNRQTGKRNAMTILNIGHATSLFWDGRAKTLEEQISFPIEDPLEMNQSIEIAVDTISKIKGYESLFKAAFGDKQVTKERIQKAIATFERTVKSRKSRFDRFIEGDSKQLTDSEIRGLHIFRTKANCIDCHNSPYFSDNQFHNDGQTLFASKHEDLGLYEVTKNPKDVGKFRTPTLRDISHTGPWMHHGNFPTLRDVILLYNLGNPQPKPKSYKGDRDSIYPKPSLLLKKLNLTEQEILDLEHFLKSLGTPPQRTIIPKLPQ
ncbi:cytochrome-c peroxidase [Flavobacteriaceae bacterium UJ101]|nr:cytochrome-c peroxidase [Flavobacteriaceae bacterium UJ101]